MTAAVVTLWSLRVIAPVLRSLGIRVALRGRMRAGVLYR